MCQKLQRRTKSGATQKPGDDDVFPKERSYSKRDSIESSRWSGGSECKHAGEIMRLLQNCPK